MLRAEGRSSGRAQRELQSKLDANILDNRCALPTTGPSVLEGPVTGASWALSARGQIRAAHSFVGEQFGPCQAVHGITWTVTVEFSGGKGPVFGGDHGAAEALVAKACARYDLHDMDAHPGLPRNTTCEVMAAAVWRALAEALLPAGSRTSPSLVEGLKVTAHESDEAYVEFEQGLAVLAAARNDEAAAAASASAEAHAEATAAAAASAAASVASHHAREGAASGGGDGGGRSAAASTAAVRRAAGQLAASAAEERARAAAAAAASVAASAARASASAGRAWRVAVRGRAMVARSLLASRPAALPPGPTSLPIFAKGPLHGNTLVVDAVFGGRELQAAAGYMIDICLLQNLVAAACGAIHNQSLDDPTIARAFFGDKDVNPTSDAIAAALWRSLVASLPPVERSQASTLEVIVVDGGDFAGRRSYKAPLWADGAGLCVEPDLVWLRARAAMASLPLSPLQAPPQAPPLAPPLLPEPEPSAASVAWPAYRVPVLLVDLDGCLFHAPGLHAPAQAGGAVASAVHAHCAATFGLSPEQCDALHERFGDTLAGLQRTGYLGPRSVPALTASLPSSPSPAAGAETGAPLDPTLFMLYEAPDGFRGTYEEVLAHEQATTSLLAGQGVQTAPPPPGAGKPRLDEISSARAYYAAVFGSLDHAALLASPVSGGGGGGGGSSSGGCPTGIAHAARLGALLGSLACPKLVCSNSPASLHVDRCLDLLGLGPSTCGWAGPPVTPEAFLDGTADAWASASGASLGGGMLGGGGECSSSSSGNGGSGGSSSSGGSGGGSGARLVTKGDPAYWQALRLRFPASHFQLVLFDDSKLNCAVAEASGVDCCYLVDEATGGRPLFDALLEALGCLEHAPPPPSTTRTTTGAATGAAGGGAAGGGHSESAAALPGAAYLAAKAAVDDGSFSGTVTAALEKALAERRLKASSSSSSSSGSGSGSSSSSSSGGGGAGSDGGEKVVLRVVDVGAGTLGMLERVLALAAKGGYRRVEYVAVEVQAPLALAGLAELVRRHGFVAEGLPPPPLLRAGGGGTAAVVGRASGRASVPGGDGGDVELALRVSVIAAPLSRVSEADVLAATAAVSSGGGGDAHGTGTGSGATCSGGVDLVVACSFADLLPPRELAAQLLGLAPGALLYLPITFAGETGFSPSDGATSARGPTPLAGRALAMHGGGGGSDCGDGFTLGARVPDDAVVEAAYHEHLVQVSHLWHVSYEVLVILRGVFFAPCTQASQPFSNDTI